MRHELNLAKRPFLNPRPVLRVTLLLWALGAVVAAFNVRLYVSHYSGSSEVRGRQQQLATSLDRERQAVHQLERELASYDLDRQNQQSVFLNAKIAERSFSWSALFDRLGEAMPADVRLTALSPSFGDENRRSRDETRENEVLLGIRGIAKSSAMLLEFIDALFAHGSFRAPNLISESLQEGGLLDFNLSVIYEARQPAAEAAPTTVEAAAATEAAAAETPAAAAVAPPQAPPADAAEPPAPAADTKGRSE